MLLLMSLLLFIYLYIHSFVNLYIHLVSYSNIYYYRPFSVKVLVTRHKRSVNEILHTSLGTYCTVLHV